MREFVKFAEVKLDYDKLDAWRNTENDDLPICSMINLYTASGVVDEFKKFMADHPGVIDQICPLDNIRGSFYTIQHMKRFIQDNWETFNIYISENNKPHWVVGQPKARRNRPKKVHAKVRNSINYDFGSFSPIVEDEEDLADDVLVLGYYVDVDDKVVAEVK